MKRLFLIMLSVVVMSLLLIGCSEPPAGKAIDGGKKLVKEDGLSDYDDGAIFNPSFLERIEGLMRAYKDFDCPKDYSNSACGDIMNPQRSSGILICWNATTISNYPNPGYYACMNGCQGWTTGNHMGSGNFHGRCN